LPPLEAHINLPAQEWENMVVMETAHESKFFDGEKYTEIYLPLRIKGKWIMLVADPQVRKTWRIMFDEWELKDPLLENSLEAVAKGLKRLIIDLRLKLVDDNWLGERKEAMWPFPRDTKDEKKIHTIKFYNTTQNVAGVGPLDRMTSMLSHLISSKERCVTTLRQMMKRHRKDDEVIERLQIVQAMFLTEQLGCPLVMTGPHMMT
jgi:hypothetical protein